MKITFARVGISAAVASLLLTAPVQGVHLHSHGHHVPHGCSEGPDGLLAAQTGTDTEFLPMIILALEILQRDTVVCN